MYLWILASPRILQHDPDYTVIPTMGVSQAAALTFPPRRCQPLYIVSSMTQYIYPILRQSLSTNIAYAYNELKWVIEIQV
jgi:hypothetical protein